MIDVQPPCDAVADPAIWGLGEAAWRRVIRSYGRRWDQARRFDWGWIIHQARDEVGPRRMLAVLRDETDRDARVRPLAELVEAEGRRQARSYRPERAVDASLDGLERLVRDRGRRDAYLDLPRWTERAKAADRAEAWRRLLVETDARRLRRRLVAWRNRRPPELHARLFELAEHEDRRVRLAAVRVLEQVKDPRVRALALRMLRDDPLRALGGGVLGVLELNAVDADAPVVDAALPRRASREIRTDWVMGVLAIVDPLRTARGPSISAKRRRSPAWTPLLLRAVETSPCRDCREHALGLLVDRGAATEAMLKEALFDANPDARTTAREALSTITSQPTRARRRR
jgi:hypothetical protein